MRPLPCNPDAAVAYATLDSRTAADTRLQPVDAVAEDGLQGHLRQGVGPLPRRPQQRRHRPRHAHLSFVRKRVSCDLQGPGAWQPCHADRRPMQLPLKP